MEMHRNHLYNCTVQIAPGQTLGELHAVDEVSVQALEENITVDAISSLLGDCEVDDSLSENDKRLSEVLYALSLKQFLSVAITTKTTSGIDCQVPDSIHPPFL